MMDRSELAACCMLCFRISIHLCTCLHIIVRYSKHLISRSNPLHDSHQPPSIPLSALYAARHAAQEPPPQLPSAPVRYMPALYASGLSEDELSRLNVCEWTRPARAAGEAGEGCVEIEDERAGCSICLCGFEVGASVVWLPCGHVHHADCIRVWLSLRNQCPECRSAVVGHGRERSQGEALAPWYQQQQHVLSAEDV